MFSVTSYTIIFHEFMKFCAYLLKPLSKNIVTMSIKQLWLRCNRVLIKSFLIRGEKTPFIHPPIDQQKGLFL